MPTKSRRVAFHVASAALLLAVLTLSAWLNYAGVRAVVRAECPATGGR